MEYEISEGYVGTIDQNRKRIMGSFLFAIVIVIFYSIKLYHVTNQFNLTFIVSEVLIICILTVIQYYRIVTPAVIVNKIASKVSLQDDGITIETLPFKILFFINKPAQTLKFNINLLTIRKTSIPIKSYFRLDNKIFVLTEKEQEAYIVFDYFNKEIEEKLHEILVAATPEHFRIPGRLRHY